MNYRAKGHFSFLALFKQSTIYSAEPASVLHHTMYEQNYKVYGMLKKLKFLEVLVCLIVLHNGRSFSINISNSLENVKKSWNNWLIVGRLWYFPGGGEKFHQKEAIRLNPSSPETPLLEDENEWMNEWMNAWTNERMDEWMNEWMNALINY